MKALREGSGNGLFAAPRKRERHGLLSHGGLTTPVDVPVVYAITYWPWAWDARGFIHQDPVGSLAISRQNVEKIPAQDVRTYFSNRYKWKYLPDSLRWFPASMVCNSLKC